MCTHKSNNNTYNTKVFLIHYDIYNNNDGRLLIP